MISSFFSKDEREHEEHLRKLCEALKANKLVANPKKCSLFLREVEFLGHSISEDCVRMDPKKLKALDEWPCPKTVKDIQSFLGFANYYRRFIKKFSKIAGPLTSLLQKDEPFIWNEDREKAFQSLKTPFSTAPVLRLFDPTLTTRVTTDASDYALGGILEQQVAPRKWHPICLESRKLIPAEMNYPVHEKELLAIVHCLRTWKHYLEGGPPFEILTDHFSLKYFQTQSDLSSRQARWSELLADYEFDITYKQGNTNAAADALSRAAVLKSLVI